MTVDIDVPDLYRRAPINVWVEDQVSKAYLIAAWDDPSVHVLVAGGKEGVSALANQAMSNKYRGVFGVVDRDFGGCNRSTWEDLRKQFQRFVLPVFELENYLLDPSELALCEVNSKHKSADEIVELMLRRARELAWWMSCRSVCSDLRHSLLDNFPEHPRNTEVTDLDSAKEAIIVRSPWFSTIQLKVDTFTESEIVSKLNVAHDRYQNDLSTDDWKVTFSGKEIFRHVSSLIYSAHSRGLDRDVDVAQKLAQLQRRTNRIPEDVTLLLDCMKRRIRTPSSVT